MTTDLGNILPVILEAFERGSRVRMGATGRSMAPFILDGDAVELEAIDEGRLRPGEIVLVRHSDGRYLLHRLVRERNGEFVCRGDALTRCDAPVERAALLARVVGVRRPRWAVALPRWTWHLAGLVWMRCSPLGPHALRGLAGARRLVLRAFRALARPAPVA